MEDIDAQNNSRLSWPQEYVFDTSAEPSSKETSLGFYSFPANEVKGEERIWAEKYLKAGTSEQVLAYFHPSLEKVTNRQLQVLRDTALKVLRSEQEEAKKELSIDGVTKFLRAMYQGEILFLEEGLRKIRVDLSSNYWLGEGNQLRIAIKKSQMIKKSLLELIGYNKGGKTDFISFAELIESQIRAGEARIRDNQSFALEHAGKINNEWAQKGIDEQEEDSVFWSSLKGFIDNL